jgi:thiol-disulfide isomerase/thioredoxin
MSQSTRRVFAFAAPAALLFVCLAMVGVQSVAAERRAAGGDVTQQSQEAADALVAIGKSSVLEAQSDEEAINRAQMSLEALTIIGQLGKYDTTAQSDKLLDELASAARPAVTESLVQLRFFSKFRQWDQLTETQRKAAFARLVSDVSKAGLSLNQARMVVQITNSINDSDGKLVAPAIAELAQVARQSKEPEVRRMSAQFEGTARRLDLPGNPIEISGTTLDGSQLDWSSYRGKVVLVDFFASWCGPCRAEVPNVLANFRAYHDKGFEVIGVNLDTEPALAEQYRSQTGFKFPTVFSTQKGAMGWDNPIARKYGIAAIPRVMLVDKEGKVVSTSARGERLGEYLGQLLGPSGSTAERRFNKHAANETKPIGDIGEIIDDSGKVVPASATEEEAAPGVPDAEPAPVAVPDDK